LADQIKRLGQSAEKINFVLGRHREEDFKDADLVIKNPGVPSSSKYLKIARENNIPIETDISIFFQLIDRKRIIGITGTRGKSTVTTLIYELIKTSDKHAVLGGNITKSPLAQMTQVKRGGTAVLELSSWMAESLEPIKKSPHIAVFTNIYPDHLNTYDGIKQYAEAKKNIFIWQNHQDYAILNRDNPYTYKMGKVAPSRRFWFSKKYFSEENGAFVKSGWIIFRRDGIEQKICPIRKIALVGDHNLENVLAAAAAAMIFGIKPAAIARVLGKFQGISDRLEFLREIKGVKYYNDTTSTMPEATLAALKALGGKKNIILIAGGSDKGLDFSALAKEIKKTCKAVVLLNGSGTERMRRGLRRYSVVESMADAVGVAKSQAKSGDIILLSPACASFGLFKNEFDRGEQFRKIVIKLK